jgi:aspartate beta-hydroxylase
MSDNIAQLVAQAGQAANLGQWVQAEALWNKVLKQDTNHPHALYSLSMHAWQRADLIGALELIDRARLSSPNDPLLALTASIFYRDAGRFDDEWTAIHQTLAIDAYFLPGLLAKAAFLERTGKPRAAAATYGNVLRIAPPEPHWPANMRDQLQHARKVVELNRQALEAVLVSALGHDALNMNTSRGEGVWQEAVSILAGRTKPYVSDCNQLHVPRLPAIPFFDRQQFSWVKDLESQTQAIKQELEGALASQSQDFTPYIEYKPGEPVNQWHQLNHSNKWSTYKLWQGGTPVVEHLSQCPKTKTALKAVDMADIDGLCPNAMFSALAPHTEIPPHHGETNARLVVHLPLIVPADCTYRVGYEQRTWKVGETLIFDDTLEHTARNDSDDLRVVLIFDVWNPLLSHGERDAVRALTKAVRAFNQE